jgi:hypothetical protein
MSKASKIVENMLAGENSSVKAIRKTQFLQQSDGSTIRKVLDADGTVVSETTMTRQQCLSLNARAEATGLSLEEVKALASELPVNH